jgi:DNA segregation ATPase FtsK/SpoIIIE-like protein
MKTLIRLLVKLIRRRLAWLSQLIGGEAAARRRRGQQLAKSMRSELSRLGFWSRGETKKTRHKKRHVEYEQPLLMTADEIWCPINLKKFPARKSTNDLRDPDVLQSLGDRCHTPVKVDTLPNGKLCLVARVRAAQFPASYSIDRFQLPPDAPMLAFPLGINADGEHNYADLTEVKHLLVAGATGGGKTTFMHTLLYTFINRCSDDDIELWLIDLKGQEFGKYEKLKGTKSKPGIVHAFASDPEKALEVLDQAVKEIKRRNQLMKQYDASNVDDLMHLSGQRLRRVVVAIDEVAVLSLDRERVGKHTVGSWAQHLITQIAALGRAVGVHSVIATQHINKEVLTGLILANFETRVCFSTADWRKSQLIIETSEANSIPTGRMFYRHLGRTVEHQAPLITPSQLRLEVTRIANNGPDGGLGDKDELRRFVRAAKLIVETACEQFDGSCAIAKLSQADGIKGVLTKAELIETCQRLERDGVLEAGSNKKPRRVARGFYKMPGLLDMRYGLAAQNAEEEHENTDEIQSERPENLSQHSTEQTVASEHPDEENGAFHKSDSAFCVRQKSNHDTRRDAEEIHAKIAATAQQIRELTDDNPELQSDLERSPWGSLLGLTGQSAQPARSVTSTVQAAPPKPESRKPAQSSMVYTVAYTRHGQRMSLVIRRNDHRGVATFTSRKAAEEQARQLDLHDWQVIPDTRENVEARARRFEIGLHII